jgi:hypothetical protein
MPTYTIKINAVSIRQKVDKAIEAQGKSIAHKKAYDLFYRSKQLMLRDFDEHPVTLEIKAGPRALNTSNTLDGYGNLFSFIGFPQGSDPIAPLKLMMDLGTFFRYSSFRTNTFYFKVVVPSKSQIDSVSPMPWEAGNSWTEGVERGITNLSNYIYRTTIKGRSKQGLQTGEEVNEDLSFKTIPYLTEILSEFRERINNSKVNN